MRGKFCLAVLLVLLVALIMGCGGKSGPSATVEKYYRLAEQGKMNEALKLLDKQSYTMVSSMGEEKINEASKETAEEMKAQGGIKSIDVLNETVEGDSAEVSVKITMGNGDVQEETHQLIKEEGQWKLSGGMDK